MVVKIVFYVLLSHILMHGKDFWEILKSKPIFGQNNFKKSVLNFSEFFNGLNEFFFQILVRNLHKVPNNMALLQLFKNVSSNFLYTVMFKLLLLPELYVIRKLFCLFQILWGSPARFVSQLFYSNRTEWRCWNRRECQAAEWSRRGGTRQERSCWT